MNHSPSHIRALLVPHGDHSWPSRMLPADTPWPHPDQVCRQCFQERSKYVLSRLKHFRISREEQWKLGGYHWHYGANQDEPGLKGLTFRGRIIEAMSQMYSYIGSNKISLVI